LERDVIELVCQSPTAPLARQTRQAFAQRVNDRLRLGLAGQLGQPGSQTFGFVVSDVQRHM
jgi:hypothetical protein